MGEKSYPIQDITIRDNNHVQKVSEQIYNIIIESGIDIYTAIGMLESIKQEMLDYGFIAGSDDFDFFEE